MITLLINDLLSPLPLHVVEEYKVFFVRVRVHGLGVGFRVN